ncbi:MAG: YihA family ribosome biogenesis GTP-binding protein [Chlorobi bacterium]|nr:YihA family ribosome biogenesis GTP-binding protein [Chlorobiota bacterium]
MEIKKAEFIVSNTNIDKLPKEPLPEYAFIGRSNVGKSSLINMLTGRKALAKTSGTPGKTRLINHFKINDNWFLVDLPGYGYAKTSKTERKRFLQMIRDYLKNRKNLVNTFVLVDARIKPQKSDLEFMEWLGRNQIPFSIVFTKADKLSSNELSKNIKNYQREMLKHWSSMPPYFVTSSQSRLGRKALLDYIESLNNMVSDKIKPVKQERDSGSA